eukprot:RCo014720
MGITPSELRCTTGACTRLSRSQKPVIDINHLLQTARTGDIVLLSGTNVIHRAIRVLTVSRWSHVGMIIRDPDPELLRKYGWDGRPRSGNGFLPNSRAYLFERVWLLDASPLISRGGPVLRPLVEALASWTSDDSQGRCLLVGYRQLRVPGGVDRARLVSLRQWMLEAADRRFMSNAELVLALLPINKLFHREDLSTLFCSQLVAECLKRLRLLPNNSEDGLCSSAFLPKHFGPSDGTLDKLVSAAARLLSFGGKARLRGVGGDDRLGIPLTGASFAPTLFVSGLEHLRAAVISKYCGNPYLEARLARPAFFTPLHLSGVDRQSIPPLWAGFAGYPGTQSLQPHAQVIPTGPSPSPVYFFSFTPSA